jgi:hypothetical protein
MLCDVNSCPDHWYRMGNSPSRLTANDGCPLVPYERQSVQEVITNALQQSSLSLWSTVLPIVLIDIIIDYSGIINGRHIINFDDREVSKSRAKVSIGWISSHLSPRHGPSEIPQPNVTSGTDTPTTMVSPPKGSSSKTSSIGNGESNDDQRGWRAIYGTFPAGTSSMQLAQLIDNYVYIITRRNRQNILIRCHVHQLFASAVSDTIPSTLSQCESLIVWQDLALPPGELQNIMHNRVTSCVWKGTRLVVACSYYGGGNHPHNGWYPYYYDTITNEWHVNMPRLQDAAGRACVSVLYNDYLFIHFWYSFLLYHEDTNKWLEVNNPRNMNLPKQLRLIISAPKWLTSLPLSFLMSNNKNVEEPPKSIIIGVLVNTKTVSHQLSYYIIDTDYGTTTLITSKRMVAAAKASSGINIASISSSNWTIPKWCNIWPDHPIHVIDDHWLLLPGKGAYETSKRSGVVAIDDIRKGASAWKWYEPYDLIGPGPNLALICAAPSSQIPLVPAGQSNNDLVKE